MTTASLIEYVIKENDTLQGIAKNYLQDSSLWLQIAVYNNLEYPYIADIDQSLPAEGYVQIYRDPTVVTNITIPIGSIFKSVDINGVERKFSVIGNSDYIFYSTKDKIELPVRSVSTGRQSEEKKFNVNIIENLTLSLASVLNLEAITVFKNKSRATGMVTFYRDPLIVGDLVIPYGTIVKTSYNTNTKMAVRTYYVSDPITANRTLYSANSSVDVQITCSEYGEVGNIQPFMIDSLIDNAGGLFSKVENKTSITNGYIKNVKYAGDTIYIPQLTSSSATPRSGSLENLYTELLFEDLLLTEGNDLLIDVKGDLMSVKGIDNLSQSIRDLVKSELGYSVIYHPEYGSLINSFIGDFVDNETIQLVEEELIRSIKFDKRVADVKNIVVIFDSGVFVVDLDILVAGTENIISLRFAV